MVQDIWIGQTGGCNVPALLIDRIRIFELIFTIIEVFLQSEEEDAGKKRGKDTKKKTKKKKNDENEVQVYLYFF